MDSKIRIPLDPNEPRPVRPFDIIVPLMGADAHLATIHLGATQVSEDGAWFGEATIKKGSALSDAFWTANSDKIADYISKTLRGYAKENS